MANPPITIGPFDNVPAPGSPIRSDWAQEISHYVVDLAAHLNLTVFGYASTGAVQGGITGRIALAGTRINYVEATGAKYLVAGVSRFFKDGVVGTVDLTARHDTDVIAGALQSTTQTAGWWSSLATIGIWTGVRNGPSWIELSAQCAGGGTTAQDRALALIQLTTNV